MAAEQLDMQGWEDIAGSAMLGRMFVIEVMSKLPALQEAGRASGSAPLQDGTEVVANMFTMLLRGVVATTISTKPKPEEWGSILDPAMELSRKASKAQGAAGADFQHARKAAEECCMILSMLAQTSPYEGVRGVKEGIDFYITKGCQKGHEPEVAWVKALAATLRALENWCKENCKMGFVWAGEQDSVSYFKDHPLGARGATAGGAPKAFVPVVTAAASGGDALAASFRQAVVSKLSAVKEAGAADGELAGATASTEALFGMLLQGIEATATCSRPKNEEWAAILEPVMEIRRQVGKTLGGSSSDFFNAKKATEETCGVVSILAQHNPFDAAKGVTASIDFYITKACQKKHEPEVAWARALSAVLRALETWCKDNAKDGFTWGSSQDAASYFKGRPLGCAGGGAAAAAPAQPKAGMGSLLGGLAGFSTNKLNKVTDDMKTKNMKDKPALGPQAKAPAAAAPKAAAVRGGKGPRGPPRKELQNERTWIIENYDGERGFKLDEGTMSQGVFITNCKDSTFVVSTKVKNITLDNCLKVNLICGDVLSVVELVNSDRCAFQVTGTVNSIAIDKCSGVALHLNKESLGAEITSAKSSEMNVNIPNPKDPEDTIEMPIPEQFVTTIQGTSLKTGVSHLYS